MKLKTCKVCKAKFEPIKPLQAVCGFGCAVELGIRNKTKQATKERTKQRQERRQAKEKLKTRGDYAKEAQIAINAYRRELTRHLGCISCGTHNGKMNGGHFRSVGSSPATRYLEENIWCQCERCNSYLSGNLIEYRKRLLQIIGQERLDILEGPNEHKHYSLDDLKEIRKTYKQKLKEIQK